MTNHGDVAKSSFGESADRPDICRVALLTLNPLEVSVMGQISAGLALQRMAGAHLCRWQLLVYTFSCWIIAGSVIHRTIMCFG